MLTRLFDGDIRGWTTVCA